MYARLCVVIIQISKFNLRYVLSLVASEIGIQGEIPSVIEMMYESYAEAVYEDMYLEPGAKEIIPKLKRMGLMIGIISNSSDFTISKSLLEREGLFRLLDALAISVNVIWRKPHKKIFDYALREAGVKAEEAVHVGNSLEDDVLGANRVGTISVWKINKT